MVAVVGMNVDAYVSRGEASYLTGVSTDAIGKWRARGWYAPDGTRRQLRIRRTSSGRLLYLLADILDAEKDTFFSGKSRRGVLAASTPSAALSSDVLPEQVL